MKYNSIIKIFISGIVSLLITSVGLSQPVTHNVSLDEEIVLRVKNEKDHDVQWQISYNNEYWQDIEGALQDTFYVKDITSSYYRALIFGDNCDTSTTVVNRLNVQTETFVCGVSTVQDIDGNIYNTVEIGGQCWTRENLRTTKYSDGTVIPQGTADNTISYGDWSKRYWYVFDDNEDYKVGRGLLYTWCALMNLTSVDDAVTGNVQGACPTGWHVPSDDEWKTLEAAVGLPAKQLDKESFRGTDEAIALKEGGSTGFDIQLVGVFAQTEYTKEGFAYYWTSTKADETKAWVWCRGFREEDDILRNHPFTVMAYSARFVKDE